MTYLRDRLSGLPVLDRIRLITLVFGVLSCVTLVGQIDTTLPELRVVLAVVAMLAITGLLVATWALGRITLLDPLLAPLAVLVGSTLLDPLAATGICVGIAITQALYGSTSSTAARLVLLIPILPLSIALYPHASYGWFSPRVVALMPTFMLFSLLLRVLKSSLEAQTEISAREALLASTSRRLLGCTDLDTVHQAMVGAGSALVRLTPGLVLLSLVRKGSRAKVLRAYGMPDDVVGKFLDIGPAARADKAELDKVFGGSRHWRSVELDHDTVGDVDGDLLLLGLDRKITADLMDTVGTLSAQMSMAETACRAHAELQHRAHHDELTAMPNRAVLFHRLSQAVEEAHTTGTLAAVMVIDLDDFKTVNDTFGHAAGDDLLVEVARRMADVVGAAGMAARFGGDEFAVLIPRIESPDQVRRLGNDLLARLLEPVRLAQATVTVGSSIGLAFTEDGQTAGDLLRCADVAMYAAKAGGKNRVEIFSAARHGGMTDDRLTQPQV